MLERKKVTAMLKKYRGNEEKLSEWGFQVVVGQARGRKKMSDYALLEFA